MILEYTPLDLILDSSSIHSTGATFGTFSVGIFTATVLKSTGIEPSRIESKDQETLGSKNLYGYVGINTVLPQNN